MRTIKFRGKRLDNGEWVYGHYADYIHPDCGLPSPSIIYPIPDCGNMIVAVDPSTVGQFTGLLDRNGKEIYEGDILQDDEIRWEIFWCDDVAAFMAEQYQSESDAPKMFLLSEVAKDSEIIGNIHEQSKS